MNYYKKGNDYVSSDLRLDLEPATKEEYDAWTNAQNTKQALLQELAALDLEAIRPIRAKEAGTATQEDLDRLAEIDQQAAQIRAELQNL